MIIKTEKASPVGTITAPPSKSYAIRSLIMSCISGKQCAVCNTGESEDVKSVIRCLLALGYSLITDNKAKVIYTNSEKRKTPSERIVLDCGESGAVMRFMLALASALGVKAEIRGSAKLLSRPSSDLIEILNEHGADIREYKVNGKIEPGEYVIDGSVSSQYISGLMMALSVFSKESRIVITGKLVSKNYIKMTEEIMKELSINVRETDFGFVIKGSDSKGLQCLVTEGDYSGAAFFLAAGAIGGNVTVNDLNCCSVQGDMKISEILRLFGAEVDIKEEEVTVKHNTLKGIELDCKDIPDLVQIISVVAVFAEGKTILKNIERLKFKESDRVKAIEDMLKMTRTDYEITGNSITILGGNKLPHGGTMESCNDHRTVMSLSVLGMFTKEPVVIIGSEAVNKSYPDFFTDYKKIGGVITDVSI